MGLGALEMIAKFAKKGDIKSGAFDFNTNTYKVTGADPVAAGKIETLLNDLNTKVDAEGKTILSKMETSEAIDASFFDKLADNQFDVTSQSLTGNFEKVTAELPKTSVELKTKIQATFNGQLTTAFTEIDLSGTPEAKDVKAAIVGKAVIADPNISSKIEANKPAADAAIKDAVDKGGLTVSQKLFRVGLAGLALWFLISTFITHDGGPLEYLLKLAEKAFKEIADMLVRLAAAVLNPIAAAIAGLFSPIIYIVIGVAVVGLIGLAVYFIMKHQKNQKLKLQEQQRRLARPYP